VRVHASCQRPTVDTPKDAMLMLGVVPRVRMASCANVSSRLRHPHHIMCDYASSTSLVTGDACHVNATVFAAMHCVLLSWWTRYACHGEVWTWHRHRAASSRSEICRVPPASSARRARSFCYVLAIFVFRVNHLFPPQQVVAVNAPTRGCRMQNRCSLVVPVVLYSLCCSCTGRSRR
jgi:hypothetical protein